MEKERDNLIVSAILHLYSIMQVYILMPELSMCVYDIHTNFLSPTLTVML